ncbi:MAG TPA: carboxypeptidase-like regulatory domain-containing protein [Acidimicrobiales bacterium]|nr:carboxypeptidase-like regulatory domain-containing protein [Acidimicrobiales bacterium]
MSRRRWVGVAALLALALVASGCTKGEVEALPPAPSLPATTTTLAVDLSGIALAGVGGRTTTTIAMQPGQATISGTVVGPEGPVPGAVVRAERVVGDASGSIDILSGADGTFAFTTMVGGRYRVRAWKPAPDNLALTDPEVFFLEAKESKVLALTVRPYRGVSVSSDMAPNPPPIGEPVNLVIQVVDQVVDGQGIVRGVPVAGSRVELFGAGDWRLRSANPTTTDGNGRVGYTLECQRTGNQPLSVVVGDASTFPLQIPACTARVDPDDGTSGTTAPPATGAPAPSTTAPGGAGSTTTTARPATTTTARPPTSTTSTTR